MGKSLGIIGFWAFIIGLVIAVIGGLVMPANEVLIVILVILGIIIGFLNITSKEKMLFLVAVIALIAAGKAFAPLTISIISVVIEA